MLAALLALALGTSDAGGRGLTDIDLAQPTADVPGSFAAATAAFSARLNELHPPGSPIAALRAALDAEGFVPEGEGAARLTEQGFMCDLVWIVTWTEAAGAIASIDGLHDGICL